MNRETFSAGEAMGLLGKEVRISQEFKSLPLGTAGRIIQVRLEGKAGTRVAVQWQSCSPRSPDEFTKAEFGRFLAIVECSTTSKP